MMSDLRPSVIGTSLLASLGGFLFGLDIGYIGPIEGFPGFQSSINRGQPLTSAECGLITAIFSLGALIASFPHISSFCNDTMGRRATICLGTLVFLVGVALQATASGFAQILAGRFVAGVAVGALSATVPMYQSEVAPQAWRGTLGATYQWSVTWGILAAFLIDRQVNAYDDWGWRLAIWAQAVPAIILLLGMLAAPRSPRWLALRGRNDEALQTLRQLRSSATGALEEFAEIRAIVEESEKAEKITLSEVFSSHYVRRLAGVGMLVMLLQQLCGMNAFMYYGTVIFEELGLDSGSFNLCAGLVNCIATLPGLLLIDRFGRRNLLLTSGILMMIACVLCGFLGTIFTEPWCATLEGCDPAASRAVPVMAAYGITLSIFLFIASFASGWGPVAWVYCAEIFPLRQRSMALGLTTCTCWFGNYLIAQLTPVLFEEIRFKTFHVFAAFCGLCTLLAYWLPETKGVALEDMQTIFAKKLCATEGPTAPLHSTAKGYTG